MRVPAGILNSVMPGKRPVPPEAPPLLEGSPFLLCGSGAKQAPLVCSPGT